ncbi:MAG: hypothetical protein IH822_05450 [Chloroflexi bacterium]|nr:hypothetical protein [Chloroflexota bacterium]
MSERVETPTATRAADGRLPAPQGGSRPPAQRRRQPRRLGPKAALNRYKRLLNGRGDLPSHKDTLLRLTCRLVIHAENLSSDLSRRGELREDGEPKTALTKRRELQREIGAGLAEVFSDDASDDDPISALVRGEQ